MHLQHIKTFLTIKKHNRNKYIYNIQKLFIRINTLNNYHKRHIAKYVMTARILLFLFFYFFCPPII